MADGEPCEKNPCCKKIFGGYKCGGGHAGGHGGYRSGSTEAITVLGGAATKELESGIKRWKHKFEDDMENFMNDVFKDMGF